MNMFAHYRDFVGSKPEKFFKDTLFNGDHLMVGINCLEPGQIQHVHDHSDADKVYLVMEGVGTFTVGDEVREAGGGEVVWSPAGVPHGVANTSGDRLVIIVCIAPSPS